MVHRQQRIVGQHLKLQLIHTTPVGPSHFTYICAKEAGSIHEVGYCRGICKLIERMSRSKRRSQKSCISYRKWREICQTSIECLTARWRQMTVPCGPSENRRLHQRVGIILHSNRVGAVQVFQTTCIIIGQSMTGTVHPAHSVHAIVINTKPKHTGYICPHNV